MSQYQFRESIELIRFVEDAADLFSKEGIDAFHKFGEENSKWFSNDRYLFIYDLEGNCIFHPVLKNFIGQNLIDLKDMNGKPIIRFIVNIASRTDKPYGWMHYLWTIPGEIFPSWKNAYIMRVNGPDGRTYAIGSGTNVVRTEVKFVVDIVDSAASLIEARGKAAYEVLVDKSSLFFFNDIYIFVIDTAGKMLVDPAYPTTVGRDISGFRDYAGNMIIREILRRLENQENVYISYLWPAPGHTNPSKKMMYTRKVKCGNNLVIVGSSLYNIEPIWKKF